MGCILHIDGFGNLITNIKNEELLPETRPITVAVGNHVISGLSHTYAQGSGLIALLGSSGYLEIALKEGNAGALLEAETGSEVKLSIAGGKQ